VGLGIQEGEIQNLNFVWLQAPGDLLPVVHLPVQDPEVHPVAAVQVGGYPGHRALHFAALPGDLHLCLPGMMGAGEDVGTNQGPRCSPRSLWLTNLCADRDGLSARGCEVPGEQPGGPWRVKKKSLCFWSLLQAHCKVLPLVFQFVSNDAEVNLLFSKRSKQLMPEVLQGCWENP